jgi:hypothetical protein
MHLKASAAQLLQEFMGEFNRKIGLQELLSGRRVAKGGMCCYCASEDAGSGSW